MVNFAYGCGASTLNTGTKTNALVDLERASTIFEKLVSEGITKGCNTG